MNVCNVGAKSVSDISVRKWEMGASNNGHEIGNKKVHLPFDTVKDLEFLEFHALAHNLQSQIRLGQEREQYRCPLFDNPSASGFSFLLFVRIED